MIPSKGEIHLGGFFCCMNLHYLYKWKTLFLIWWSYWSNITSVNCFCSLYRSLRKIKSILADFLLFIIFRNGKHYAESGGFIGAI